MSAVLRVLFVCVHNAARSRIAEALLRQLGGPRFEVTSAGFEPRDVNLLPGVTQRIYWSFPDPASFAGSHAEKLARIIEVRDSLRAGIESWLATLSANESVTRTPTGN